MMPTRKHLAETLLFFLRSVLHVCVITGFIERIIRMICLRVRRYEYYAYLIRMRNSYSDVKALSYTRLSQV